MKKTLLAIFLTLLIAVSVIFVGCKAKVEVPPESQMTEAEGTLPTEPAATVATETIPPSAVPEVTVRPVTAPPKEGVDRNKEIQTAVKNAGFYAGAIDGKIGPKTRSAIEEFQKAKGLKADGVVGKKTWAEEARAIYEDVIRRMSYDKTIPGWGRGDTARACLLGKGNCTDFHSLFVSLARASNIPAKFVIGFSIPKQKEGEIDSYHCWAEFYDDNKGWVPVDISEAWKNRERADYYFGNLDEDRIEFTEGRDIILEPPANAGALNYFIYPYAEIEGKPVKNVKTYFRFKEIPEWQGV